MLLTVVLTVRV